MVVPKAKRQRNPSIKVEPDARAFPYPTSPTTWVPSRFSAVVTWEGEAYRLWLDVRAGPGLTPPTIYEVRLQCVLTEARGITSGVLRSIKLDELRRLAIKAATSAAEAVPGECFGVKGRGLRAAGRSESEAWFVSARKTPGRGRRLQRETLEYAVEAYEEAVRAGDPAPTKRVGEKLCISRSRAGALLVQARKEGLLAPARKGRAG